MEKKLVEEKLRNLHSEHAEESADYGIKRARMHGWPNTYVFTKAMGEMLLAHHNRDTVPLVILRPTMVTSTYQEPFPGWLEGVRTIDGVAVGYAKGKLKAFPFNPKLTVDVIPADMVINALIMAMVEYANRSTPSEIIYHVGSSLRNPFKFSSFQELNFRYFVQNPLIDKDGKPIKVGKVTAFSSMASFRIYMAIRYSLALKVFHLAINTVLFQKSYKDKYIALERKLKRGMRLAELYEPYVFFKGIFDDANSEKLQIAASKTCSEAHAFNFDPTSINWETYMMDAHFPGLENIIFDGAEKYNAVPKQQVHFVFVEKILRVQPEVKKLYLLLRAVDTKSAEERLHNEVIGKALFDVLREQHGANFLSFISEKLSPVPGDISCVDLGIRDSLLKDQMWNEVDTVINFAATTNFDERYDVALGINTMGALHLLNFVKKCNHVKVLGHLSTAYVCGEDGGFIKEKPFRLGTAKKSTKVTDIGMEKKLVEESAVTTYMKDYGIKRARMHGWPNTYVFTKAMGEMLLVHHSRDTVPLVILRPTMVTSTYQEPFPGWLEGVRTIDGVAVGYAKGKLKAFPFNPKLTVDVIPADMVINALIMAMVEYANRSTPSEIIYHVGSSLRNPFTFSNFQELNFRYFVQNPLIDKDGKPIKVGKVTAFSTMASFRIYMAIRYSLALKVFHLAISTVLFQKSWKDKYIALERNLKRAMRLQIAYSDLQIAFLLRFDDANSEELQIAATKTCSEAHAFNFDPTSINWEAYMMGAHFPGLVKHVLK
uniref:Fatty acyl-CoA reductase n=1 Tax=Salix viminalis TaxID=40686 RepID=A0A6N2MNM2_SALVM